MPERTYTAFALYQRRPLRIGSFAISGNWFLAGVWLLFLQDAFVATIRLGSPIREFAGLAGLLVFCGLYVSAFSFARKTVWAGAPMGFLRSRGIFGSALLLTVLTSWIIGEEGLSLAVYDAVIAVMVLRTEWTLAAIAALIAGVEISSRAVPSWTTQNGLVFSILLAALAVWGVSQMAARNIQLDLANDEIAQLAVSQERTRFARDLHDLLGHSLTVITMKSELAGRLVGLDPERAEKEIAEVEQLARDALADVRAAVGGYREVTLARELVSARTALDAAGIAAELPTAVDEVPGDRRELFGWAVREGVTNVVRHSGASRCRVALSRECVQVVDDGGGLATVLGGPGPNGATGGSGLRGLRERAEAVGAAVSVGEGDDGRGFRLRVGW
jgi:two-component system sensor histidine kinase DesK